MFALLVPVVAIAIVVIPAALAVVPLLLVESTAARIALGIAAPLVFAVAYALVAALISVPFRRAIIAGRFPRRLDHAVYGPRRIYGLCWTAVYYAGPIYQLVLTIKTLRRVVLRLFGYRGSLDLTLYADTWIRDLPLLEIGDGAYLSNKATIGTNICMMSGDILVDKVTIERGAMVGHLTMLAPGVVLGEGSEVGVGCAIGIRVKIGKRVRIGPGTVVNHMARIGDGAEIGTMTYIGAGARIAPGVRVPSGTRVADRAVVEATAPAAAEPEVAAAA